jgi:linoleoyl-CoA desaturase
LTITPSAPRVRFAARGAFSRDLDSSANAYFASIDGGRRDLPRMYLKTAIILAWFAASWFVLVFVASNAWQGTLAAISLGLSIAGVGMSVQHDANHGAYSRHGLVNRVFGRTLDVMGVCSFIWRPKHNVGHHTFTNVAGVDYDLDFGVLARLSPEQPRRRWHRYQHFYLWFFYGFLLPKWVFFDDWVILKRRLIGVHTLPEPGRAKLFGFIGWKLFFLAWAIVIPALLHPLWQVLVFHLVAAFTLGATLGTVFQLAHCTREAEFPEPRAGERIESEWAVHQLATCVDFAPKNGVITWFVGGLNYQVEHHLFPNMPRPSLRTAQRVVRAYCDDRRIAYTETSLFGSYAAALRHLHALGEPLRVRGRVVLDRA